MGHLAGVWLGVVENEQTDVDSPIKSSFAK